MASLDDILTVARNRAGEAEALATIGSGALADIPAGLGGAFEFVKQKARGQRGGDAAIKAAERVEQLREKMTYQPRTDAGKAALGKVGDAIEWGGEQLKKLPGAEQAQKDWYEATTQAPGLTAAMAGIAGVVEPKGARAASRAGKAAKAAKEVAKTAEGGAALRAGEGAAQGFDLPTSAPPSAPALADLRTPEGVAAFKAKYGRDPVSQMDEATRVKHFGPAMAETPEVPVSDIRSRRQINMPGGFGKDAPPLTLADQAKISAQAIDYNTIDPGLAQMLHERLVQSVDPGAKPSTLELANRLGFGVTSGNAPITKNLIEHAASRPRSKVEMQEWADMSPGYGVKMEPEARKALNRAINEKYSLQSGERGGIGVANTANKQFVADLNKMLLDKPEVFRRIEGEPEAAFVERLMNTVRGLGPKTGSLGFAMVEPQTSNISAIDRHIADLTRTQVKNDPVMRAWYENQMLQALNLERAEGAPPAASYREALERVGPEAAEAIEAERFRDTVSTPTSTVYRSAKTGEINPDVPSHLREPAFGEPQQVRLIGPQYQSALDIMQSKGAERGIGGFSNQWLDWDYKRSRAEPHAALNPMATGMKRMTPEEYKQVQQAFSEAGAFESKAQADTGRMKPLKKTEDFRRLIYGQTNPELAAVLLGLSGAGAGYGYYKGKEKDDAK